jgi:hypothetical protein
MRGVRQLSFTEYYKSKKRLLEMVDDSPRIYSYYKVKSYRKIPLTENYDSDDRIYESLKPKDIIKILWEYENVYFPTARNFIIIKENGEIKNYYPCWSNKKLLKWVMNNADEISENDVNIS